MQGLLQRCPIPASVEDAPAHTDKIFAFACAWALGGALQHFARAEFSAFLTRQLASLKLELPSSGLLYDYGLQQQGAGLQFVPWAADVEPCRVVRGMTSRELWVSTEASACVQHLTEVRCLRAGGRHATLAASDAEDSAFCTELTLVSDVLLL